MGTSDLELFSPSSILKLSMEYESLSLSESLSKSISYDLLSSGEKALDFEADFIGDNYLASELENFLFLVIFRNLLRSSKTSLHFLTLSGFELLLWVFDLWFSSSFCNSKFFCAMFFLMTSTECLLFKLIRVLTGRDTLNSVFPYLELIISILPFKNSVNIFEQVRPTPIVLSFTCFMLCFCFRSPKTLKSYGMRSFEIP